jgi:hypothetical protein
LNHCKTTVQIKPRGKSAGWKKYASVIGRYHRWTKKQITSNHIIKNAFSTCCNAKEAIWLLIVDEWDKFPFQKRIVSRLSWYARMLETTQAYEFNIAVSSRVIFAQDNNSSTWKKSICDQSTSYVGIRTTKNDEWLEARRRGGADHLTSPRFCGGNSPPPLRPDLPIDDFTAAAATVLMRGSSAEVSGGGVVVSSNKRPTGASLKRPRKKNLSKNARLISTREEDRLEIFHHTFSINTISDACDMSFLRNVKTPSYPIQSAHQKSNNLHRGAQTVSASFIQSL